MGHTYSHDQRIAATNLIFRELVMPNLAQGEGAVLMTFAIGKPGILTYIGSCERQSMREVLTELLAKWQREAQKRSEVYGLFDVIAERRRQVAKEGYDEQHDDAHQLGELAQASAAYSLLAAGVPLLDALKHWPWDLASFKDHGPRKNLIIAGALNLAELERRDRAQIAAAGKED